MKRVLLVDDEKDFLFLVKENLKEAGFEVIAATNGRDALIAVEKNRPDIIVLDIALPDIDGATISRKLEEDPATSGIPIIFISGVFSRDESEKQDHFLHGKTFLPKTFDMEELIAEINKLT